MKKFIFLIVILTCFILRTNAQYKNNWITDIRYNSKKVFATTGIKKKHSHSKSSKRSYSHSYPTLNYNYGTNFNVKNLFATTKTKPIKKKHSHSKSSKQSYSYSYPTLNYNYGTNFSVKNLFATTETKQIKKKHSHSKSSKQSYDNLYPTLNYNYGTNFSVRYQSGYIKSNGTYVEPHYKTNSNNTNWDNFSTKDNYNPYTGKRGSIARDYSNDVYNYGTGKLIQTGPKGGQYYINSKGNKVYVPKR